MQPWPQLSPLASFQSVLYSSAHARAQREMALLVVKTRFGHVPDAAVLGYEKDTVYHQKVMFIVRHLQINEEAI